MTSKTAMLSLVRELRWKDIREALEENPNLLSVRDERGRNWLHLCCRVDIGKLGPAADRESVKVASLLLERGLPLNGPAFTEDNFEATPLWYAISFGRNLTLARYLLKSGSDPNHCLFAAAYNNDTEAIKLLLKYGANIDPVVEDATPFLFAVQWSRFKGAETLLEAGANVDHQNSKGITALHCLLKKGAAAQHIQMLLDYNARGDIPDKKGVTAASIMMRKRDPEFRRMAEAFK